MTNKEANEGYLELLGHFLDPEQGSGWPIWVEEELVFYILDRCDFLEVIEYGEHPLKKGNSFLMMKVGKANLQQERDLYKYMNRLDKEYIDKIRAAIDQFTEQVGI